MERPNFITVFTVGILSLFCYPFLCLAEWRREKQKELELKDKLIIGMFNRTKTQPESIRRF